MWLGPAPWRPYCGQATGGGGWWHDYDYAIGFIAGWGAHPLDILVWGYDTHLAGKWEVEGTATIPTQGRNNVVMKWDVDIRFENGVKMKFLPGRQLHPVHRHRGLDRDFPRRHQGRSAVAARKSSSARTTCTCR